MTEITNTQDADYHPYQNRTLNGKRIAVVVFMVSLATGAIITSLVDSVANSTLFLLMSVINGVFLFISVVSFACFIGCVVYFIGNWW